MIKLLVIVGVIFLIVMILFFYISCKLSGIESRKEEEYELEQCRIKYRKGNNI